MTSAKVKHFRMLVGGEDTDSPQTMTIVDPSDESVVATVARGEALHIDAAVTAAKNAFEGGAWSRKTRKERATVMRQIAAAASDAAEELVELEMACNGATIRQATGFHIGYALAHFSYFADLAETYEWQRPGSYRDVPGAEPKRDSPRTDRRGRRDRAVEFFLAVDGVLYGCFIYSAQACESGTRILVPRHLQDEFVDRMIAQAKTIVVGPNRDWDTDMGPVIDADQRDRILGYIEGARSEGATVAFGGTTMAGEGFTKGFWAAPTIITGVRSNMRIAREEVFGPVLSVIVYDTDEEAVAVANDSDYGLAASIWSTDNARALTMAERIQSDSVWINDAHRINCQLPFGGYKQSGLGRELGSQALDAYTEVKTVALDVSGGRPDKPYALLLSPPKTEITTGSIGAFP